MYHYGYILTYYKLYKPLVSGTGSPSIVVDAIRLYSTFFFPTEYCERWVGMQPAREPPFACVVFPLPRWLHPHVELGRNLARNRPSEI